MRSVIFDLDDTLIECGIYYREATRRGAELIQQATGLPAHAANKLIGEVDLASVAAKPDFSRERFPKSFVAAYNAAALVTDSPVHSGVEQQVYAAGDSVFTAEYAFRPGAEDVLRTLRGAGYALYLVTKGDASVQLYKINKRNIYPYFDQIHVVAQKSEAILRGILQQHGITPSYSYYVGDSLKDDIAPALANGMTAIHIAPTDQWSYNVQAGVVPTHSVSTLSEILTKVPLYGGASVG